MFIVAVICLCLFAALAVTYDSSLLQRVDQAASEALFGNNIVSVFHYVGETVLVVFVGFMMIGYLLWRKKRLEALLAFSTIFIGYGINQAIKNVVERPRPILEGQLTSYSFPSAHTMASLLWIVTLLYILTYGKERSRGIVVTVWGIGLLVALLGGLSRVAQGHHFFTDVLAGWMLATAWLFICMYMFTTYKKRTKQ